MKHTTHCKNKTEAYYELQTFPRTVWAWSQFKEERLGEMTEAGSTFVSHVANYPMSLTHPVPVSVYVMYVH